MPDKQEPARPSSDAEVAAEISAKGTTSAAKINGRFLLAAALIAAIVAIAVPLISNGNAREDADSAKPPSSSNGNTSTYISEPPPSQIPSDAAQVEKRYDGHLANGHDGSESKCADPPPSQEVSATKPSVFGPDGSVVGIIELRTSPICPVIWARVLWNGDIAGTYQIPAGWTLHVVVNRPDTRTRWDETEQPGETPIQYALSAMLTTVRGCVYAEAYFTNETRQTKSAKTSCAVP
jgi:hypothetical protein